MYLLLFVIVLLCNFYNKVVVIVIDPSCTDTSEKFAKHKGNGDAVFIIWDKLKPKNICNWDTYAVSNSISLHSHEVRSLGIPIIFLHGTFVWEFFYTGQHCAQTKINCQFPFYEYPPPRNTELELGGIPLRPTQGTHDECDRDRICCMRKKRCDDVAGCQKVASVESHIPEFRRFNKSRLPKWNKNNCK